MFLTTEKTNRNKVGYFRFKELDNNLLITNEVGDYGLLDKRSFREFIGGDLRQFSSEKYKELKEKGFFRDKANLDYLSNRYASKNLFLGPGASLHIVVVTLRCDHRCIYCQANAQPLSNKGLDMGINTAKKVVDFIIDSPNTKITIEFQGGEPLANFDTIRFIVNYALKKNKKTKKQINFTLSTNFSFMNSKILKFLINKRIPICTSLDGPEHIHNKYRLSLGNRNNYRNTLRWIRKIKQQNKNFSLSVGVSALTTITNFSLPFYKEIIDEFIRNDLNMIHLRYVSPMGSKLNAWKKMSYSAEEFLSFYQKAMDYIIELNLKGKFFIERYAEILLTKILTEKDPNYLDLRSPCGAGIGQIAYNFNGDVYTCDEGRMLSRLGDESFRLGNVETNTYRDIICSDLEKSICIASCLDNLAGCNLCVYKPYCGVCPIYNYKLNGNIFSKADFLCKINQGILDYLFRRLNENRIREIFQRWVAKNYRGGRK